MIKLLTKLVLFALAALAMPAASATLCTSNCLAPGDYSFTMNWGGIDRSYLVHVPASYTGNQPVALTLDLHGHLGTSTEQRTVSGQLLQSDRLGFIAVWPQGFANSWNGQGCCTVAFNLRLDDVGFIRAIIGTLKMRANIDADKVYATGLSNGGGLAHRLACEAADEVRAIAPISHPLNAAACSPSRPVTVVAFAGTADVAVPYAGNPQVLPTSILGVPLGWQGARASLAAWKMISGCSNELTRTQLAERSRDETYESCTGGMKAGLVTFANGQHCLYNGDLTHQLANLHGVYQIDVARYIWDHVFIA